MHAVHTSQPARPDTCAPRHACVTVRAAASRLHVARGRGGGEPRRCRSHATARLGAREIGGARPPKPDQVDDTTDVAQLEEREEQRVVGKLREVRVRQQRAGEAETNRRGRHARLRLAARLRQLNLATARRPREQVTAHRTARRESARGARHVRAPKRCTAALIAHHCVNRDLRRADHGANGAVRGGFWARNISFWMKQHMSIST
eukprot:6174002-Pleurochrysis_carterae.AAC.2